jgi:hypothetical protein
MANGNKQRGNNTNAGRGAGDVPADLRSPYAGVDSELAEALAEAFPAPKPDMTETRILRADKQRTPIEARRRGQWITSVTIPTEMMKVLGWRQGDQVVMSAWIDGVLRVVKKQDV